MAKKKTIKETDLSDEQALVSLMENKKDEVLIRGKKYRVGWMHLAIGDWVSKLMTEEGNDNKVLSQAAALIVLNGFWKCHFFYWILWRWFYYIKQYSAIELMPLFQMAQKKTAQEGATAYLNAMMLLTALSTTKKQMTKEEARLTLQELRSGKGGK